MDADRIRPLEDYEIAAIRDARPYPDDPVNGPPHYQGFGSIECIDAMRAMMPQPEFVGFLRGNALKYLWRFRDKGGAEDLKKARWYLDRLIAEMEGVA